MNAYGGYDDLMILNLQQDSSDDEVEVPEIIDVSDDEKSVDMDDESDDELEFQNLSVYNHLLHPGKHLQNLSIMYDHLLHPGKHLQNLSMISKMKKGMSKVGKGLKTFEKGAIKARDLGEKASPYAN